MTQPIDFVVTKSNALIQASYKLSLNEQRLVLACVAQLDGRKPLPKDNLFTLSVADFADTYSLPIDQAYEALKEASNSLYERDIKVFDGKVKERFRWIYHVKYHDGEGKVSIGFSPTISPYLTMLNKQFTSYQIKRVAALNSAYSIRLFELLSQYKNTGLFVVKLADFKAWLEIEEKYPRFFDLCRRILDPAVKELQEESNLAIKWCAIRKGRSVERLEFTFQEDNGQAGEPPAQKPEKKAVASKREKRILGVPVSEIEKFARPGESYEAAAARIANRRKLGLSE
jgi:plasmid replication initiation protein